MKLLLIHIGIQFPDDLQTKKTIFSKHRQKIKPQHCIIVCTVKNVKLRLFFSLLHELASIKPMQDFGSKSKLEEELTMAWKVLKRVDEWENQSWFAQSGQARWFWSTLIRTYASFQHRQMPLYLLLSWFQPS